MELSILNVLSNEMAYEEAIGGFVGSDFYGSGYDNDFYRTAIESIKKQLPEYFEDLNRVKQQVIASDFDFS